MKIPKLHPSEDLKKQTYSPEVQLVAAITARGISDYIMLLMIKHCNCSFTYDVNHLRTASKWLRTNEAEFSAFKCCSFLNLPWDSFMLYIAYLDSIKENEPLMRVELNKYC